MILFITCAKTSHLLLHGSVSPGWTLFRAELQEKQESFWKAGMGKIQPHSGLDGAPGSSLLAAAKAEVTNCQPGPEFLLNASQITQEVHSVIHFAPERTLHTGWVNPAALDSPDIMNTHKKCKLNSLCDRFVMAFPAS